MMRRLLTAVALIAVSTAAYADCKEEVATALDRQRKSSGFRMEAKMISAEGKVDMTVEYVLPDRMRQIVRSTMDPEPVETMVVGPRAWSRRAGEPWMLLNPQLTQDLVEQMDETIGKNPLPTGDFECMGKMPVAGKNALAYQGENEAGGPKNLSKDQVRPPDRPVRVIYVDTVTGLPVRSIFARANQLDKPIFEATYSYPADLKIEGPKLGAAGSEAPKPAAQTEAPKPAAQ